MKKARVLILGPLAGTYRGGQEGRMMRTHAIYEDAPKAFCGYKGEGLVDEFGANPEDVVPTCPRCREVFGKRLARGIIEPVEAKS
jgi:hypothetical protein